MTVSHTKDSMAHSARIAFERKLCVKLLSGDQNMVISPYSAGVCVSMVLAGADNDTRKEMCVAMGIDDEDEDAFMRQHTDTTKFLNAERTGVQLVVCNSLWADGRVEDTYKTACKDFFDAEVFALTNKEAINTWISDKTHKHIPELLKDKVNGPSVVVNAVWFKGTFQTRFDKEFTKLAAFYPEAKEGCAVESVMVPTMKKVEKLLYTEHKNGQVVDLEYGNSTFSLVIILPWMGVQASLVLQTIIGEDWSEVQEHMRLTLVELYLPKCSLKYDLSLKSTMQDMGMKEVFDPSKACLDRLMKQMPGAFITDILQAATIDVTEEGVEAAAATAAPSGCRGTKGPKVDPPIEMRVNRPYILMVRDNKLDVILFAAVVNNPKVNEVQEVDKA